MEQIGNTWRGWVIVEGGKIAPDTLRRTRPEAWSAWENRVRPNHGFAFDVKARRVRVRME